MSEDKKEQPAETMPVDPYAIDVTKTHQLLEFKHDVALTTLRVDPTQRFAAAGAEDLNVQIWDLETQDHRTLEGHKSWVRCIDFAADGNQIVTACWGGVINIWETNRCSPNPTLSIKAHQGSCRFVRVSPDGKYLATCGNDLLVKIWNVADGKQIHQFTGHDRHVYGVDFHPDGNHVVSQDLMGNIKVWNLQTAKLDRNIESKIMTGFDNKFRADMGGARDITFKPDGTQWASAGIANVTNSFAGVQDPIIVLFDWETGKEIKQLKPNDANVKGIAWGVRFHPDGFIIAAIADRTGKGELWFYKPGEEKSYHTMKMKSAARGFDLLADNRRVAIAHADGHVRLYRMTAKADEASKA